MNKLRKGLRFSVGETDYELLSPHRKGRWKVRFHRELTTQIAGRQGCNYGEIEGIVYMSEDWLQEKLESPT